MYTIVPGVIPTTRQCEKIIQLCTQHKGRVYAR